MPFPQHRTSTLQWLNATVTNFQSNDDPRNLALFSLLGPNYRPMHVLLSSLQDRVLILPYHQITFEAFTNCVLLVRIRQRSDAESVPTQARMPLGIMEKLRAALMNLEQHDFQHLGLVPLQQQRRLQ